MMVSVTVSTWVGSKVGDTAFLSLIGKDESY